MLFCRVLFLTFSFFHWWSLLNGDFPGGTCGKEPSVSAGDVRDVGLFPGLGRSRGEGHGNPLQYSCLENPMDRGAWLAMVHRVAKSWILLRLLSIQQSKFVPLLFFKLKFLKNLFNWRLITLQYCGGFVIHQHE